MEDSNVINNQSSERQLPPENNLAWAIVSTLLCCWPLGIPAIINAAKVDRLWANGYREEAIEAANNAKTWAKRSLYAAIAVWLVYVIFLLICTAAGTL